MAYETAWQKIQRARQMLNELSDSDSLAGLGRLTRLEETLRIVLDALATLQSELSAASWPDGCR